MKIKTMTAQEKKPKGGRRYVKEQSRRDIESSSSRNLETRDRNQSKLERGIGEGD
jgi:hypothetical protein